MTTIPTAANKTLSHQASGPRPNHPSTAAASAKAAIAPLTDASSMSSTPPCMRRPGLKTNTNGKTNPTIASRTACQPMDIGFACAIGAAATAAAKLTIIITVVLNASMRARGPILVDLLNQLTTSVAPAATTAILEG